MKYVSFILTVLGLLAFLGTSFLASHAIDEEAKLWLWSYIGPLSLLMVIGPLLYLLTRLKARVKKSQLK